MLGLLMSIAIAIADRRLRRAIGGTTAAKPEERDRVVEIS